MPRMGVQIFLDEWEKGEEPGKETTHKIARSEHHEKKYRLVGRELELIAEIAVERNSAHQNGGREEKAL